MYSNADGRQSPGVIAVAVMATVLCATLIAGLAVNIIDNTPAAQDSGKAPIDSSQMDSGTMSGLLGLYPHMTVYDNMVLLQSESGAAGAVHPILVGLTSSLSEDPLSNMDAKLMVIPHQKFFERSYRTDNLQVITSTQEEYLEAETNEDFQEELEEAYEDVFIPEEYCPEDQIVEEIEVSEEL